MLHNITSVFFFVASDVSVSLVASASDHSLISLRSLDLDLDLDLRRRKVLICQMSEYG